MSELIDNDPRWIAAAIDRAQQETNEAQTRALENQAAAILKLISTAKFTSSSIVKAVTSNDLASLERKNSPSPRGKLIA